MKSYFVITKLKNKVEIPVVRELRPDNILLSYYYFRTIPIKEVIEVLGYKPRFLLDSGAYSSWNNGKEVNLQEYLQYIDDNREYIDDWVTLDVIGDEEKTYRQYMEIKEQGYDPIPVFHFGSSEKYLKEYIKYSDFIALGNTVPIRNKSKVARWINHLTNTYPDIKFHLLGSSSKKIIKWCPDLYSLDSSSYVMMAINGYPKHIADKVERAKYQMQNTIKLTNGIKYEQKSLF